jgi:hypothetical protein
VTSQEADFDAGLDFDCFLLTGFFETLTFKTASRISSSFIGLSDIGLALAITTLYRILLGLTIPYYNSHIKPSHFLPPQLEGRRVASRYSIHSWLSPHWIPPGVGLRNRVPRWSTRWTPWGLCSFSHGSLLVNAVGNSTARNAVLPHCSLRVHQNEARSNYLPPMLRPSKP